MPSIPSAPGILFTRLCLLFYNGDTLKLPPERDMAAPMEQLYLFAPPEIIKNKALKTLASAEFVQAEKFWQELEQLDPGNAFLGTALEDAASGMIFIPMMLCSTGPILWKSTGYGENSKHTSMERSTGEVP